MEYDLNKLKMVTNCEYVSWANGPFNGITYSTVTFCSVYDGGNRASIDTISQDDYNNL